MRSLTLLHQLELVKRWDPTVKYRVDRLDGYQRLLFTMRIQPTTTSQTYTVQFSYIRGCNPHIRLVSPALERSLKGRLPPHRYRDGSLCVCDPKTGEWKATLPLIQTVVPWTSRWLFHYEHFLAFDEWLGDHSDTVRDGRDSGKELPLREAA